MQIAGRAADDAITPHLADCVPDLLGAIVPDGTDADHLATSLPDDIGLLEGATGVALALHTVQADTAPVSG